MQAPRRRRSWIGGPQQGSGGRERIPTNPGPTPYSRGRLYLPQRRHPVPGNPSHSCGGRARGTRKHQRQGVFCRVELPPLFSSEDITVGTTITHTPSYDEIDRFRDLLARLVRLLLE